MTLDSRVADLLKREFVTIRMVRDPALRSAVGQIHERMSVRGLGHGTPRVFATDKRCAAEYLERSTEFLEHTLRRLTELRQPWTGGLRIDVEELLKAELGKDWGSLVDFRDKHLGPDLKNHQTGQMTTARDTALRRIEEELAFRVLREEKRRLPIAELLAPPRYAEVLRHWEQANEYADRAPSADKEAVREAILALEAMARLAGKSPAATLGDALKVLNSRADDAGRRLFSSIEQIWAFSNRAPSVRHGGGSGDPVNTPEAQYVVGVTREAIRLLLNFDLE